MGANGEQPVFRPAKPDVRSEGAQQCFASGVAVELPEPAVAQGVPVHGAESQPMERAAGQRVRGHNIAAAGPNFGDLERAAGQTGGGGKHGAEGRRRVVVG